MGGSKCGRCGRTHRVRQHASIPRGQLETPGRRVKGHKQGVLALQWAAAKGAHLEGGGQGVGVKSERGRGDSMRKSGR